MRHPVLAVLTCLFVINAALGNVPPDTPTINEPEFDGQISNPADVHMETLPFSDADVGDAHLCTDWEIRLVASNELVWRALCVGGLERIHAHLGDGAFIGTHSGASQLLYDTDYRLRVRHRDDSGDAPTEWSDWAERLFTTGPETAVFPIELDDVLDAPVPMWNDASGLPIILPSAGTAPALHLESAAGETLLTIQAFDGIVNTQINPPPISEHEPARLRISPGSLAAPLALPETTLEFTDDEGEQHTLYLPTSATAPGTEDIFWIDATGATYYGQAGQTEPDFSQLARGAPVPWVTRPGFTVEVAASGFQLPVNIAFVPNPAGPDAPLYYVTELYGTIKVVTGNGTVSDYATGLLNFNPTGAFPGSGEQGLTGIVVDPANGDVIVTLLYDAGGPHYPKVERFTSTDGGLTASGSTILLDMVGESQGQSHQISNVSFGPDGMLYVHMGDGFNAGTAQNLDSYRGKILRMTPNGVAPSDNPFYNAGNGINSRDYVFAYGVRNPFGGGWRASDGFHYEVENGPSVDRMARVVEGRNYLWDGSNGSMFNFALYAWHPAHAPTNILFLEPGVFGGSGFPAGMMDHALVAESGPTYASGPQSQGKKITEFVIDQNGDLVSGPTVLAEYAGQGKATVVALAAGPDGIYFSDFYKDVGASSPIDGGARIMRVRFKGAADFTADVVSGDAPLSVTFTDLSTVNNPTGWYWTFGDGGTSTDQHPVHVYLQDGAYDVRLLVTGPDGSAVVRKNAFVQVGETTAIALVGGSLPPFPGDSAMADHLRSLGFAVNLFDDEPGNRPDAATLAADYDLVIISSTVSSSNIAGQFRTHDVPVIFWEQALLRTDRIPLMDSGEVTGGTSTISILDNSHPITQGLALGPITVFSSPGNMSVGRGQLASGAQRLAQRDGAPGDTAIVVADAGATLLGGHIAPARRAFLFFEDSTWLAATPDAEMLFDRTVCWALDAGVPSIAQDPQDASLTAGQTLSLSVIADGTGPFSYQWRRNGANIPNAGSAMFTIVSVSTADAGTYDVVVSTPCGTVTSAPAVVTVSPCPADFDGNGIVNTSDFVAYLNAFNSGDLSADFALPFGVINTSDFIAFLNLFTAGCP